MWAKEKDYLQKAIIISILFKLSQRVKMLKATKHKLSNNNFIYTLVRKLIIWSVTDQITTLLYTIKHIKLFLTLERYMYDHHY